VQALTPPEPPTGTTSFNCKLLQLISGLVLSPDNVSQMAFVQESFQVVSGM
jgi:hypothetical protein